MLNELDLLYLAQPLIIIAATTVLLVHYYWERALTSAVMGLSCLAYFTAIAGKVVFQLTVGVPSYPILEGLYFGLQTSILEVGLAYVVAAYAISKAQILIEQAPAYGAALAFWENGVLLGVLAIPGLVFVISTGGSGLPSGSLGQVVGLVALGTLERVSSILVHFSWGILVVAAAVSKRAKFLLAALPMGLIDSLVPFAGAISLAEFEAIVFALSALCFAVTYIMTREEWPSLWKDATGPSRLIDDGRATAHGPEPVLARPLSPASPGTVHAHCPKCKVVFEAERNPLLPHLGALQLRKCPACGKRSFMPSDLTSPLTWPEENRRLP